MSPVSYQTIKLSKGKHASPEDGACVMELASMLAGEPFTDHPASACPVIGSFLRSYNDSIDETRRQSLYEFATKTAPPIDLQVGSWYVSTHPSSHFVTNLVASLVTAEGRCNLAGRQLAIHRAGGTEKIELPDAAAVVDTLCDRFGIDVADIGGRSMLEARINEVSL